MTSEASMYILAITLLCVGISVAFAAEIRKHRACAPAPPTPRLPVPISDHILVCPIERPLEVAGMARPQSAAEMPSEGVVLLVGPGRVTEHGIRVKPEVEAGDLVSFPSYAGKLIADPVGLQPGQYLLVRQDEIFLNHGPYDEAIAAESESHE